MKNKTETKFVIIMAAVTLIFALAAGIFSSVQLNSIQKDCNAKIIALVEKLRDEYPNLSEAEIAELINGDTGEISGDFEKYGIKAEGVWAAEDSAATAALIVCSSALCVVLSGCAMCLIFALYRRAQRKEQLKIVHELAKINRREYDLDLAGSNEGSAALMAQEINKTVTMLREYADNEAREREILKNSLTDISHQLKTPLTSISLAAESILEGDDMPPELRREFAADIMRSASSTDFLVKSLLSLSMLDSGTVKLKRSKISAEKILDECVGRIKILAEIRGVSIEKHIEGSFEIECDFRWICEAITNILKNCAEHTQSGGTVKIEASRQKLYDMIVISDNGDGIAPDDLPHIFKRFYKAKNSPSSGVGIGLSLAKAVIDKSGGTVTASSILGRGAKFTVKLYRR